MRSASRLFSVIGPSLLALLSVLVVAPAASAQTSAPAWKALGAAYPTVVKPGQQATGSYAEGMAPELNFTATNVGSASTTEPVLFSDILPGALTPVAAAGTLYEGVEAFQFPCEVVGQEVTCEEVESVKSGSIVRVVIGFDTSATPPLTIEDDAVFSGGGAAPIRTRALLSTGTVDPPFGFLPGSAGLSAMATDPDGVPTSQAGAHPFQLTIDAGFPSRWDAALAAGGNEGVLAIAPVGHPRDIRVTLPRGMAVDPTATPQRCTEAELTSPGGVERCPPSSQVGMIAIKTATGSILPFISPLYNMVPPKGEPAELAFNGLGLGIYIHLFGHVNSEGLYELSAASEETLARPLNVIYGFQVQLWGDPSDPGHDPARPRGATVEPNTDSFITMPTSCTNPLPVRGEANTWEASGELHRETTSVEGPEGEAIGTEGCDKLAFEPTLTAAPTTTSADSPTGLDVHVHQPQDLEVGGLSTAALKDAVVELPAGLAINPSGADGLLACSPEQIGLLTPVGQESQIRFSESAQSCPAASKIGSVEVSTPLLEHELPGAVYVARPYQNPFGSLLAIYLVVEDEESGIVAKLAGHVEADPATGRLRATFRENPQLPLEEIGVDFFEGSRAVLGTPLPCGSYATGATLTPWSTPAGADVSASSVFGITTSPAGNCATSEAQAPAVASFSAGTESPQAGAFSPFSLRISRGDGTQHITSVDTTLPYGLLAKLAGVAYCPEAGIVAARAREAPEQGRLEVASPSCPAGSEIGTVVVGAGSGATPLHVTGHAYLAGPYKGAPLSLAIVTPAIAGPFDLGDVVTRVALHVDQTTAQIHAVSDPLPTILDGIPLDIRSIELKIDRPDFILNPTSCEPMQVSGSVGTQAGGRTAVSDRFQVGGCSGLPFKPRLKLQVIGRTNRNAKPRLKAVLTTSPGEANIRRAQVNLPHSLFLEQSHIKAVCTRVQWAEGNGNGSACPAGSIYGKAKAWTPLLNQPLEGYVYLRSNGGERKLPDMVAALNGQVDIALWGKVDSGKNQGLRNTFEVVPDAPVSRFVLELNGKKKGLLVNSEPLCSKTAKRRAIVRFTGQNGKVEQSRPKVVASCRKPKNKTSGNHQRGGGNG